MDEVIGLKNLERQLKNLPLKVERSVLRGMVRAGGQVVRKSAVRNLEGGANKDLVLRRSRRKSQKGREVVDVAISSERWYLRFKETGTAPHTITTSKKKVLSSGEVVFGVEIQHPGQAATPFLRPALDGNVKKIIEAMRKYGEKRIEKEAAKR